MKTFTYSFFAKLLYRYGNIIVSFMILIYLIPAVLVADTNLFYLIPITLLLLLLYYINKRFLYLYKIVPYRIDADDQKMTCTNFLFSKKEAVVFYKDIVKLTGGIFDGKLSGLMQVYDGRNKIHFGFFARIQNVQELQTIILSRVTKPVYDEVVERVAAKKKRER